MAEATINIETEETTEKNEISGRIGFSYAGGSGAFLVSRVAVEFVYTETRFARWTIHFPVEPGTLPGIRQLIEVMGTSEDEVFALPPDEEMQVSLSAKPEVLGRLSTELLQADRLSTMFRTGNEALLDLDNYESGVVQIVTRQVAGGAA